MNSLRKLFIITVLMLSSQFAKANLMNEDTLVSKIIIDTLIRQVNHNKAYPLIIMSKINDFAKKELWKLAHNEYALPPSKESFLIEQNDSIKGLIEKLADVRNMKINTAGVSANIRYAKNAWKRFNKQDDFKNARHRMKNFICVAAVTRPVYYGNYALSFVDYQFGALGGGAYLHICRRKQEKWQTFMLVELWSY